MEVRVYLTHPSTDEAGDSLLVTRKRFVAERNEHHWLRHLQNLGMLEPSILTPHSHLIKSAAIALLYT